jgi:hypothetical protein
VKYLGWSRTKGQAWRQRVSSPDEAHCFRLLQAAVAGERFIDTLVLPEGKDPNSKPSKAKAQVAHALRLVLSVTRDLRSRM